MKRLWRYLRVLIGPLVVISIGVAILMHPGGRDKAQVEPERLVSRPERIPKKPVLQPGRVEEPVPDVPLVPVVRQPDKEPEGIFLNVQVNDLLEAPIPEVVVTGGGRSVSTDRDGKAVLGPVKPGEIEFTAQKKGFPTETKRVRIKKPGKPEEVRFVLLRAVEVIGKVVENFTGNPISGATVTVDFTQDKGRSWYPGRNKTLPLKRNYLPIFVSTDDLGKYSMEIPQTDENLQITATAQGYLRLVKRVNAESSRVLDMVLSRGGSVEGVVQSETGTSIAGATVCLISTPDEPRGIRGEEFTARSNEMGRFTFAGLPKGEYHLSAWTDTLMPKNDDIDVVVGVGKVAKDVIVTLVPGGSLRANVLDKKTRKPVGDLGFSVFSTSRAFSSPKRCFSDPNGLLLVHGLRAGTNEIDADEEKYLYHEIFEVELGKTKEMDILLDPAVFIEGRVVDSDDDPVSGADVDVGRTDVGYGIGWCSGNSRTDSDGTFLIGGLPLDSTYLLTVRADGYSATVAEDVPSGSREVLIRLQSAGSISGRVVDAGGKPVDGAFVGALIRNSFSTGNPFPEGVWTTTNESGNYCIRDLYGSIYDLVVFAEGFVSASRLVELLPDRETSSIDFVLEKGFSISGRVHDKKTGEGISEVELRTGDLFSAVTDGAGEYCLDYLTPGKYKIVVSPANLEDYAFSAKDGRIKTVVVVDKDLTGVDFPLSPGGVVTGRVSKPDGSPVEGATVSCADSRIDSVTGAQMLDVSTTTSNEYGEYVLTGVRGGKDLTVTAYVPGYSPGRSYPFALENGEQKYGVNVWLTAGGSLSGTVRDEKGNPLSGVLVCWGSGTRLETGTGSSVRTVTNAKGYYILEGIPEVRVFVFAMNSSDVDYRELDFVDGSVYTGFDFVLNTSETWSERISGTVVNAKGEGIVGCRVKATWLVGVFPMEPRVVGAFGAATTDQTGSFKIEGLRPGQFLMTVESLREAGADPPEYIRRKETMLEVPTANARIIINEDPSPPSFPK